MFVYRYKNPRALEENKKNTHLYFSDQTKLLGFLRKILFLQYVITEFIEFLVRKKINFAFKISLDDCESNAKY